MNFRLLLLSLLSLLTLSFIACNSTKKAEAVEEESRVPESIRSKILVTLMDGKSPEELELSYEKYALEHLSIASRSQNQHLFQFDRSKISTKDLLKKLNRSKMVYLAESLEFKMTKTEMIQSSPKKKVDIK